MHVLRIVIQRLMSKRAQLGRVFPVDAERYPLPLDLQLDRAPVRYGARSRPRRPSYRLAALMLRTMEESATSGFEVDGGDAWKAFARALWAEKLARDGTTPGEGTR
jgi:hypothetical protein